MSMKEIIKRLSWMFKVKDCRGICLLCGFYEICRAELATDEEQSE